MFLYCVVNRFNNYLCRTKLLSNKTIQNKSDFCWLKIFKMKNERIEDDLQSSCKAPTWTDCRRRDSKKEPSSDTVWGRGCGAPGWSRTQQSTQTHKGSAGNCGDSLVQHSCLSCSTSTHTDTHEQKHNFICNFFVCTKMHVQELFFI